MWPDFHLLPALKLREAAYPRPAQFQSPLTDCPWAPLLLSETAPSRATATAGPPSLPLGMRPPSSSRGLRLVRHSVAQSLTPRLFCPPPRLSAHSQGCGRGTSPRTHPLPGPLSSSVSLGSQQEPDPGACSCPDLRAPPALQPCSHVPRLPSPYPSSSLGPSVSSKHLLVPSEAQPACRPCKEGHRSGRQRTNSP